MFQLDPRLLSEMDALFDRADQAMAEAAANFLRDALNKPGTGTRWPGLPNPSSAPGQYPARQSGDLVRSIGAQRVSGVWQFGSFNAPPEAWALEYPRPQGSPIDRSTRNGARPWLSKSLNDPQMIRAVWAALDPIFGR